MVYNMSSGVSRRPLTSSETFSLLSSPAFVGAEKTTQTQGSYKPSWFRESPLSGALEPECRSYLYTMYYIPYTIYHILNIKIIY